MLDRAATQTVTEFKRSLTSAVHRVDPASAEQRHQQAKAGRGVWLRGLPDGMAGLYSIHDAVTAEAMMTRIAALAGKAGRTAGAGAGGDTRSADARRADTLADLVLNHTSTAQLPSQHGRRPTVHLLVPLDIALGLSDLPGELLGYGPIPATLCRDTLTDPSATIRRAVIGPLGELADCSTSYEPSQALTDKVILRDRTCRMPGCNRRTCTCELDHIEAWDGTNTIETNLHGLCCRHHHAKHDYGWTVTVDQHRVTRWTSPAGRHYTKPPDPWPESPLLNPEPEPPPDPPPF